MPTAGEHNCLFSSKGTLPNPLGKEQLWFLYENVQVTEGGKKIQIPLKSTTPISVATPWIKIPRTASTSIGKLCFYNGCSVNIRKTSLATKDSTIYLIKHFLPILIVFGSWNLCKREAIQRKAAWAAPSKTFAYLGSLKKNKISILYTF